MTNHYSTDQELLAVSMRDYFEIDSEITALEATQKDIRRNIETLTVAMGGNVKLAHIGSVIVTEPSTSHSYDTKAIDGVIAKALQDGDVHIAKALSDARKETTRAGGLRITKAK